MHLLKRSPDPRLHRFFTKRSTCFVSNVPEFWEFSGTIHIQVGNQGLIPMSVKLWLWLISIESWGVVCLFVPGSHIRAVDHVRSPPLQLFQQQQQQQKRILRSLPERKLIFSLRFLHLKLAVTFKNMSAFFSRCNHYWFCFNCALFDICWHLEHLEAAWEKKTILNCV